MHPLQRRSIRSKPKPVGLPKRVADLQRSLTTADLNPEAFQRDHSAISRNRPEKVTSLGETGGPVSTHWQDGPEAKVLISNINGLDGRGETERIKETVLAHINKFQQDGLPLPQEIYLDTKKGKVPQRDLNDFTVKLVEGVNELNDTNFEIRVHEDVGWDYIRLKLGTRQAEELISVSGNKSARNLVKSDSESDDPDADESSIPLLRRTNQNRSDEEGAPRSNIRSATVVDERLRDQAEVADTDVANLSKLASKILTGAQISRDEALGLREGNMQLLEGLKGMYDNLLVAERRVLELERQIEATLPTVIPLKTVIGFQPNFQPLNAQTPEEVQKLVASYKAFNFVGASTKLEEILKEGLKPADSLKDKSNVALSGDETLAHVVSVNVLPYSKDAKKNAEFVTTYRAGGVIPIAIEQKGDGGAITTANLRILTQRAVDSAVLIIDPNKFDGAGAQIVQQSQVGGGGEVGLPRVEREAIVAVLAPATMHHLLDADFIAQNRIHFVGAVNSPVYYASARTNVELSHPDYKPAIEQILTNNPNKTMVLHTTRLGNPMPTTK